ncbi:MAG: NUMOD4 domain-containing protein [Saprospiraceae bacterium]
MSIQKVKSHFNEEWKDVDFGKETKTCHYKISNFGRIKSIDKVSGSERLVKGSAVRGGLKTLNQKLKDNSTGLIMIHKFVAENFVRGRSEERCCIIHKDYNKGNNYSGNLMWVTQAEWSKHNLASPYRKKERTKTSQDIMNESKVKLLKRALKEGKTKRKVLAKSFGIKENTVYQIQSGRRWGHVKLDEDGEVKSE